MRYLPGDYEVIPNGITIPPVAEVGGRDNNVVFVGRNDPRKGLEILLRAWPEVHGRTGARLRVVGTAPPTVRLAMTRAGLAGDSVDLLGVIVGEPLTHELSRAKLLVAPSLGGESFGMVLTRAFGCATPVVASDIPGYRRVMTPEVGVAVPPGDREALAGALIDLLEDEPRRQRLGSAARAHACERFAWDRLARRLLQIYEQVIAAR
jgi:phosphatidylinositol alpha-mannosyltransferase